MEFVYSPAFHRRSQERFKVDASAIIMAGQEVKQSAILKDLSARGAGILSNYLLKASQEVSVIIQAPFFFTGPLQREAKVAWSNKIKENLWEYGFDFGLDNQIELS